MSPDLPVTRGLWYADPDTDLTEFSGATPPKKLLFTLTGKCNLRCDHCPRGVLDVRASETPAALVDHVIREILPKVRSVRIGGTDLGEQLTSRHFDRFLEAVIATPPKHLEIVSNLTVLDEARADLIARGCDDFGVSLEGVGEAFERVRHFPWSRIRRHLVMLEAARRRHPESRLKVFCLVTCFFDNLGELESILELASEGVRRFEFRLFQATVPAQESQRLEHHQGEANRVFDRIEKRAAELGVRAALPPRFEQRPLVERDPAKAEESSPQRGASRLWVCHFPFESASIYSDGRVSPCCEDIPLGQLSPERPDLLPVFRGETWRELRRQLASGDFQGRCKACGFRLHRQAELDLHSSVR